MAAVLRSGLQWAGRPGFSPGRRPNAAAIAAAPGPLAGDPAAPRFRPALRHRIVNGAILRTYHRFDQYAIDAFFG
ncbi:MAG TPA: hypothetical protein VEO01_26610 [Pseudonocardiaceae bacterium]|nr:hypothetical protein [Pseudonocardiaceae bacterium]